MNKRILLWVLLVAALAVFGYSGYRYYEIHMIYVSQQEAFDVIRDLAVSDGEGEDSLGIPDRDIDWDELHANVSEDIIGWIYSPGTPIDYPIMRADDYSFFLSRLPDGTFNANGSIFLDFNHSPDFSDPLSVIYGHHMRSGAMFGTLNGYRQQSFFEDHPVMFLYTPQQNYRIDLMYGFVVAEGEWRRRAFMFQENIPELLEFGADRTTFSSDVRFEEGDRILAMSTCEYDFDDARYVVLGILRY
ncbi:MAG: class B sortase [Coriobacteriia bacterium]|nr:class B sortase [Coriobacteriia bacterium]MCL2870229.1 class B sortase [Coriobacteriia bacterium]